MHPPFHLPSSRLSVAIPLRQGRRRPWLRWAVLGLLLVGALAYELSTSALQARLLSSYASRLSYEVVAVTSLRLVFPASGSFDQRQGYTHLPVFLQRLTARGYRVSHQPHMSPELTRLISWEVSPPYREPVGTELTIDTHGARISDNVADDKRIPWAVDGLVQQLALDFSRQAANLEEPQVFARLVPEEKSDVIHTTSSSR